MLTLGCEKGTKFALDQTIEATPVAEIDNEINRPVIRELNRLVDVYYPGTRLTIFKAQGTVNMLIKAQKATLTG
ncbi:MAG: hypothetical protein Q9202_005439 [Teloschistes flavicans]